MRTEHSAQPSADVVQAAAQARAEAAQARAEAAQARAEARQDAAQARAEAQALAQGGTRIETSPDGRVTRIFEPSGKVTTITTEPDGTVQIKTGDQTTTLPSGMPWTDAISQLIAHQGQPFPFPSEPRNEIPRQVVPIMAIVFSMIALMVIGLPIARAFARRIDKKSAGASSSPDVSQRLDRIEQAIESIAEEVERVSEAQRYSARLLTERLPDTQARAIAADHVR